MIDHNQENINNLLNLKLKMGANFPKIAIFIVMYNGERHLTSVLNRIHPKVMEVIEEVFVIDDFSEDRGYETGRRLMDTKGFEKLKVFQNPEKYGYGGNQKVGFRYAMDRGFDYLILLHGNGRYAPECIPDLLTPALFENKFVVLGSRFLQKKDCLKGGMPVYKYLGNIILSWFQNKILSMDLSDYHSGYRLYSKYVLELIPFFSNSDEYHFDTQMIIQCRALGIDIKEVPIPTFYGDEISYVNGFDYALKVMGTVLEYRLHQLHIIRKHRFLIKWDNRYVLKNFPHSSHRHIIDMIKPGTKVLDIGCGQGLLVEELLKKNIDISGIDNLPSELVDSRMKNYIRWDLEDLEHIELKEKFDYVLWADVIEHIKNHKRCLTISKKFLKDNGFMIVSTGNIAIWFYRLSLALGRFNYGERGILDKTHVFLFTKNSFEAELQDAGLNIKKLKFTPIPFELVFESIKNRKVIRWLNNIYYFFVKLYPSLFAYQFLAVVEKKDEIYCLSENPEEKYVRHGAISN